MRKGRVGVMYVRDEEEGWIPVVRRKRKKSAGCIVDGLRVDRRSVMCFKSLNRIPGINISDGGVQALVCWEAQPGIFKNQN